MRFSASSRLTPAASSVSKIILRSPQIIADAHKAIVRYAGVRAAFGGLRCREGPQKDRRLGLVEGGDVGSEEAALQSRVRLLWRQSVHGCHPLSDVRRR
jgi:hypothetical protein